MIEEEYSELGRRYTIRAAFVDMTLLAIGLAATAAWPSQAARFANLGAMVFALVVGRLSHRVQTVAITGSVFGGVVGLWFGLQSGTAKRGPGLDVIFFNIAVHAAACCWLFAAVYGVQLWAMCEKSSQKCPTKLRPKTDDG